MSPFFPPVQTIDEVVAFLIDHKINAIRLPFSLEFALTPMDVAEAKAGGGDGGTSIPGPGEDLARILRVSNVVGVGQ